MFTNNNGSINPLGMNNFSLPMPNLGLGFPGFTMPGIGIPGLNSFLPPNPFGNMGMGMNPGLMPNFLPNPNQQGALSSMFTPGNGSQPPNFNFPMGQPSALPGGLSTVQQTGTEIYTKLFIKNIAENVTDEFMEKLLGCAGDLTQWQRNKNQQGEPNDFGFAEYQVIDGVLKCLRLLDNLKIQDKNLKINPSEQTESFIKEWRDLKRKEWIMTKGPDQEKYATFDKFQEKDDETIRKQIQEVMKDLDIEIDRVRKLKEKQQEQKEHPKQKERDQQKKEYLRNLDKRGKEKLEEWLKQQDQKRARKKREKQVQKEKEKRKMQAYEAQMSYDSDLEQRQKGRHVLLEKRRTRLRELEDDQYERRKEQRQYQQQLEREEELYNQTHLAPLPLPSENLPYLPEDGLSPTHNLEEEKTNAKIVFTYHPEENDDPSVKFGNTNAMNQESEDHFAHNTSRSFGNQATASGNIAGGVFVGGGLGFNINQQKNIPRKTALEGLDNDVDEDETTLNQKQFTKALEEKLIAEQVEIEQNQLQNSFYPAGSVPGINSGNTAVKFNQANNLNSQAQSNNNNQNQAVVADTQIEGKGTDNSNSGLSKEKGVKQLEKDIQNFNKNQLMEYNINWTNFAKFNTLELHIRPWIANQCIQFIGQEEDAFINSILRKLINKENFEKVSKVVSKVLDEDTEEFMNDLWKKMILEGLKIQKGLA